jgi:hypothetical protein
MPPDQPPSMFLIQARHALAGSEYPKATAAALVAIAETVDRIAVTLERPAETPVSRRRPPGVGDFYQWTTERVLRCGMVKDQTGELVCAAPAGHWVDGAEHDWRGRSDGK